MTDGTPTYSPAQGGARWDTYDASHAARSLKWQHIPRLVSYSSQKVCGQPISLKNEALNRLMRLKIGDRVLDRGISIGCGTGSKEMLLLKAGLVRDFDLFEASATRISQGQSLARDQGLEDRVRFHFVDTPGYPSAMDYDLVYWNAALHHMPTARSAVEGSRKALAGGGWFVMEEYVGPNRFQWTDPSLKCANDFRASLPDRFFDDAVRPHVPRVLKRPTEASVIRSDPTESVDSSGIVDAVRSLFPDADLRPTGGAFYHLAFRGIVAPFLLPENAHLVEIGLILDGLLETMGDFHFCTAIAQKS